MKVWPKNNHNEAFRFFRGEYCRTNLDVVKEHEVSLIVNSDKLVNLRCTDEALEELALGFLYNEKIIDTIDEVEDLLVSNNSIAVTLRSQCIEIPQVATLTSGFGGKVFCSPKDIEYAARKRCFHAADILSAVTIMDKKALRYRQTGGIHCSAIFDHAGIICSFEDVGRHNTFDKIAGHLLRTNVKKRDMLLATSGRVSSEMVCKAIRLGASVIASHSTPTDAAISCAQESGLTIAGYVSRDSFNLYSAFERIAPLKINKHSNVSPSNSVVLYFYPTGSLKTTSRVAASGSLKKNA